MQTGSDDLCDQGSVPCLEAGLLHEDGMRCPMGQEGSALHGDPVCPADRLRDGSGEGVLPGSG